MRHLAATTVPGLLIEGVDYSGKTSVAEELARRMEERGLVVFRRACFMQEHPIIDELLALAKASDRMDTRDVCYTSSILLDLTIPPLPEPPGYRLQERHTPSQIGRNTFFYDDDRRWQVDTMKQLNRRFSCQVYLTSDLDAKRARVRTRPAKSPRDAMLAADAALHQRYDDYMRGLLEVEGSWLVVDTSHMSVADVAACLLDHVLSTDGDTVHARQ